MTLPTEMRRGGRPRTRDEENRPQQKGAYIGFRLPDDLKDRADSAAAGSGRSLSTETQFRLAQSFRNEDALDQAMSLAYGEPNGGFLHLIGEVLRLAAPRGEWLEDDAAAERTVRSIVQVIRWLRAPDDGHDDKRDELEARITSLLYDLGDIGEVHQGARTRWAAEKRRRFGAEIGDRLTRKMRAVRTHREAQPAGELPKPDPATASWDRVVDRLNDRHRGEVE